MHNSKLRTTQLFAAAFLMCGLMAIQIHSAPTLRANGKIAFTSDRDGNSEIYVMNADGTNQTRLTNNSVRDDYPTWSPDGRTIAFVRQNGGTSSINLMNADGTNVRQITTLNTNYIIGLSWSPDGTKIAFSYARDIYTVNVDGTNLIKLTNIEPYVLCRCSPSWSPNGMQIAFALTYGPQNADIYTMNADGSDVRRIGPYRFPFYRWDSPDFSPDGSKIAFSNLEEGETFGEYSFSIMNSDGTDRQYIVTGGYAEMPKWSPDGTKFVFSKTNDYGGGGNNIPQIWIINNDDSGLTQLTNTSTNNFNPDWQPLGINISDIDELYMAVNNPANAGSQIALAPGIYMLSVNDANGAARPNGGRLELQENMSLQGVVGDRAAVVIDAMNLPMASYSSPLTGAVRIGRGSNALEWLTIRNAVNGASNIDTDLIFPGTAFIRVAHIASSGAVRGLNIRNLGAAAANAVIDADVIDNDLFGNNLVQGEGMRTGVVQGANGASITARLSGNRIHGNKQGLLEVVNRSNNASVSVVSSGDRFYENGAGIIILGGLSQATIPANGNTITFEAHGTSFTDNNGTTEFDKGGLIIIGGENTAIPNGTSNNKLTVNLFGCQFSNNQLADLYAVGARSNPASIGTPGTNNTVRVALHGIGNLTEFRADSIPATLSSGNSLIVSRQPISKPDDYDGDGRDDLTVFRPSDRTWYLNRSQAGFTAAQFGLATDKLVPADYDGDGKTDIAVYRTGIWYLQRSQAGFTGVAFGDGSDIPQPADYDGDGKADLAVFRPSNGVWYLLQSTAGFTGIQFGQSGDKPVAADYDGDGKVDLAVVRQSGGVSTWYVLGSTQGFYGFQFGNDTDKPVPADYDGDGKTDVAVFRPSEGNWYLQRSSAGFASIGFGFGTDSLVPADYDGDGKADVAVYRGGIWYLRQSSGGLNYANFGASDDVPTNRVQ